MLLAVSLSELIHLLPEGLAPLEDFEDGGTQFFQVASHILGNHLVQVIDDLPGLILLSTARFGIRGGLLELGLEVSDFFLLGSVLLLKHDGRLFVSGLQL